MQKGAIKTGWHLLLVGASLIEWKIAQTELKKHLALACAGWHVSAAISDAMEWKDEVKRVELPTDFSRDC